MGLTGLGRVLQARTSIEPAEPVAIDINRDVIVFFPIIYWPVLPDATRHRMMHCWPSCPTT
jgi:hypothetical protein